MTETPQNKPYRRDIDGLRAIAVVSVILFHFGYLPKGYLGVDIFFVISGYLITDILYRELQEDRLSIRRFYLRRIRRIIPLMLFVMLVAFAAGLLIMLPDDLENLSQSVIATGFFSNNILLWLTTANYWNLANEYKPLMHTWSLGVEEQFYLLYPLLFLVFAASRKKYIVPLLVILSLLSLLFFLGTKDQSAKFYGIQYRFFELALGGISAIVLQKRSLGPLWHSLSLAVIFIILFLPGIPADTSLLIIVSASVLFLNVKQEDRITGWLVENPVMTGLGRISFSLYMWHQPVLAFTRYTLGADYSVGSAIIMLAMILVLSVMSYHWIEQPFRNRQKTSTRNVLTITGGTGFVLIFSALYIYASNGVIRDVPELDEYRNQVQLKLSRAGEKNIMYNSRIYDLNKPFSSAGRIKIVLIGDSFARDWANVLLEMYGEQAIEISYAVRPEDAPDIATRFRQADHIFFSELSREDFDSLSKRYPIDSAKVWNVGTKSFGEHNGVFYIRRKKADYCLIKTRLAGKFIEKNELLGRQWGKRYINLIDMVEDKDHQVPVFTPGCKFISQDGHHFTIAGAKYFAELLKQTPFALHRKP
jgi:peptidoglycan/LPS O-acetylase OafA/YrhL